MEPGKMLSQMALNIPKRRGADPTPLYLEIRLRDSAIAAFGAWAVKQYADCVVGVCAGFVFIRCRVIAKPKFGVKLFGVFPRYGNVHNRVTAERHAAMLVADLVLKNPYATPACSEAQAEAWNLRIEKRLLALALRQREIGGRCSS
jgi:hypothetical protein